MTTPTTQTGQAQAGVSHAHIQTGRVKPKRGTVGYAINKLVEKHGQGTIGLYILEQALIRATGVDRIGFRKDFDGDLLLHETPNYKTLRIEAEAIFAALEATGAIKPSDHVTGRGDNGLVARTNTGQTELVASLSQGR